MTTPQQNLNEQFTEHVLNNMEPPKEKIFDYLVIFVLSIIFVLGLVAGFIIKWLI